MALTPIASVPLSPAQPAAVAPPVSATVAGKTYVANVNYSAGEYVANCPTVYGAEGSGPSPQAAEDAFMHRIDFLV